MNSSLIVQIGKEELKKLIESYYLNAYGTKVEFKVKSEITYSGYRECYREGKTKFYCESSVNIGNLTKKGTFELSEEEIKEILKMLISDFDIDSIKLKTDIDYVGIYEEQQAVFKGAEVVIKNKSVMSLIKRG